MAQPPIIYLAAPYSHPSASIRLLRFEEVTAAAARLIGDGKIVFSPLTMTHPIDLIMADTDQTMGSDYWVRFDEAFMHHCSEMIVLMLDGWEESAGVRREIEFFKAHGKPVSFKHPAWFQLPGKVPTAA